MINLMTNCKSLTGPFLYSDVIEINLEKKHYRYEYNTHLNYLARLPVIGILAGITRIALSAIHIFGHLCAACILTNKGHLYHAAKGGAELLRGIIEAIPVIGRIFEVLYCTHPPFADLEEEIRWADYFLIKIVDESGKSAADNEVDRKLALYDAQWSSQKNKIIFLGAG